MFIQVLNVTWKVDLFKNRNSEITSGTDKHILDSVTRITRFFECFTVSCFARDTKSNRLICGVPCPAQTHLFLHKYFEEHIFDYHGLGNKKMLSNNFLESRQENMFDSIGINIWRKNKSSLWELIQMREYL